jgi:hypothetical protein
MIINYNGQSYEIVNWDEFQNKLLSAIGIQVENAVVNEINKMKLVDTGKFKQGVHHEVQGNELIITNNMPYAVFLEYGTYDYWKQYGLDRFTEPVHPKKKDISLKERQKLPKGGQPFSAIRRVLYNQNKMNEVIERAVKLASK